LPDRERADQRALLRVKPRQNPVDSSKLVKKLPSDASPLPAPRRQIGTELARWSLSFPIVSHKGGQHMDNTNQHRPPFTVENPPPADNKSPIDKEYSATRPVALDEPKTGEHGGGERRGSGNGGEAQYGDLSYSNPGSDPPPFSGTIGDPQGPEANHRDRSESNPEENEKAKRNPD
jgi:hypothetical protein